MANKTKRSLEDAGRSYKYILDDDEQWHRIGRDDMTRMFEQLVVTPKGNKYNFVPKYIDNSEKAAGLRDKMLSRQYTKGFVGEPGLELIHPEFDILSLSPIIKKGVNNGINKVIDNFTFVKKPNSFTRGIGGIEGLNDLIETGLIRGNPIGTEMSPKLFGKMYRYNRNHFRDIMEGTGRKGIAQRYYNRSLNEEDFNAIKTASKQYDYKPTKNSRFNMLNNDDIDPLDYYADFADYKNKINKDRITLSNVGSLDDSGQPLAYFYDDGRNPIINGYDYAGSKYGVRINNASDYNPRIFSGHLHYSMPKAVPLTDPNVEVFRRGPFGITIKMNKNKLIRNYGRQK